MFVYVYNNVYFILIYVVSYVYINVSLAIFINNFVIQMPCCTIISTISDIFVLFYK